ncbi:Bro-N domain-containing protein [Streptomyces sp. NPDC096205]|uniref:BRO-N domain-containing protein n=1 Tax=Streptomyces sp. NPDC096205 TaxID=3366081 RepID=UPI003813D92A
MYEQNEMPPNGSAAQRREAIGVDDFVFAATGARVRRLTTPEGEYWFPAADLARNLGYANTRQALRLHVDRSLQKTLGEIARGVYTVDALRQIAGQRLQRSMWMVDLRGLIQLVNGCTKPECKPFKLWVSEVIATLQRDGSYTLEPAPVQPAAGGGTAYVMPEEVAEAIVRLEERNLRADEMFAAAQAEQTRVQSSIADALHHIAHSLDRLADRFDGPRQGGAREASTATPQQLLAAWRAKNLVVTEDVHAVAAYLAPALVRGEARCRVEDVAERTGLTVERVVDCVRMLLKRGCMRQRGCAEDGTPVYVLP